MSYELLTDEPFSLELTLKFDQGHRWRPDREDPGWYTSVLGKDFVRIRQKKVHSSIEFEPCNEEVAQKLRWQFRLNDDDEKIEAVYTQLRRDSKMAALVDCYRGLRVMRVDLWECLVFFILSAHNHSQSHVATAPTTNAMDEIARWFWEDGRQRRGRYPFPSPQDVGSQSGLYKLNDLWGLGQVTMLPRIGGLNEMPRRIHEAAQYVAAGNLDGLKGKPVGDVVSVLEMLPGVGPKTAHCVALFGLGCIDAFPVDAHVTRALLSLYGRDPFQPYAGYASQFLFMEGLRGRSR